MLRLTRSLKSSIAMLLAGTMTFGATLPAFAQDEHRGRHEEGQPQGHGPQGHPGRAAPQAAPQAPQRNFAPRGEARGNWNHENFAQRNGPQQQNFQQRAPQNFQQRAPQQNFAERHDFNRAPAQNFTPRTVPDARQFTQRDERHDFGRGGFDHRPAVGPRGNWSYGDRHWVAPRASMAIQRHADMPSYYHPHYLPRERWYRNIYVYRPYGLAYPGFGFYYTDADAYPFLGLAAMSYIAYNELDEMQQRAAEEAMIEATNADIGEAITWNEDGASGSVTPIREGETADGRPCREFQQDVIIDGRQQQAYGTACMQPDGSWQVVDQD